MKHVWHKKRPELLEQIRNEIGLEYPTLHISCESDVVFVRGSFPVVFDGEILDRYSVEIEFPADYPESLPVVREPGGRIPHIADFHMYGNGIACLFVPDEGWWILPPGSTFRDFLNGPVYNFFLGQSLVSLGEPWPFGQRKHGTAGIIEFYSDLLGTTDPQVIEQYIECLSRMEIRGHWPCPCGSGDKLRNCHITQIQDLRLKIPPQVAQRSLNYFKRKQTR